MLRDLVASGLVEVRAYRRSPLHAKAYLCWYDNHAEPGAAVVGSSNLTLAGFSGNTELNVRVTGDAEMAALREWFDALWEDSEDISRMLAVELERSWAIAHTPPYHVYLKALYELYHRGAHTPELAPQRSENLANFQLDAVRRGLAMIDAHGGCYVGDVVGLGKTFIGAELLRQLRISYPLDGPPLILCPAGLKPMWEAFNERFVLGAEVVSHMGLRPAGPGVRRGDGPIRGLGSAGARHQPGAAIPQPRAGAGGRGPQLPQRQPALPRPAQLLGARGPQGGAAQRHAAEPRSHGHLPATDSVPGRQ